MPINFQKQDKEVKNPKLELKNNNFSYEKLKKFLNNPVVKYSLGCAGISFTVAIAAKLIYDKIHKNEVKLDSNTEKYISQNFFFSKWERNSCWKMFLFSF